MQIKDFVTLTTDGAIVKATLLADGADLGWLSGSDPTTDSLDLVVLQQDKPLNIYRNVAPVIRRAIATPDVVAALESATAKVTNEQLDAMVKAVQVDDVPAARVAGGFIADQGLGEGLYTGPTKVVSVAVPTEQPAPPSTPPANGPLRISYTPLTVTELNTNANGVLALPIEGRDVNRMVSQARDLASPRGITVLNASSANVSSAWSVSKDFAANTGITTLSELARVSKNRPITIGGPPVCPERVWRTPFLQDRYGVKVGQFVPLDWGGGLTRAAIDTGSIDVGWLDGNDGGIEEFGFRVLTDDLGRESVNPITPVLNTASVTPEIAKVLIKVSTVFTTDDLREMNYAVEFERRDIESVVVKYLKATGLA